MASETAGYSSRPIWYSVTRSLVTHYWPFTIIVLAFTTIGMAVAREFDPFVFAATLAVVWVTMEGFHAIDLADPELTLDVNSRVQRIIGYGQVLLGAVAGIWLAARTTWLFIVFVVLGTVLGLAYNEEWFDGRLHDRDRLTGLANFGFVWGAVPVLAGYTVLTGTIHLGVAFIALGCALFSVTLNMLEGPAKEYRYEQLGIKHDREADPSVEEFERKAHRAQLVNTGTFVSFAVGLLLLFGPV